MDSLPLSKTNISPMKDALIGSANAIAARLLSNLNGILKKKTLNEAAIFKIAGASLLRGKQHAYRNCRWNIIYNPCS